MVVITWRETAEPIAAEEYANEVIIPVAWLIDCVKRLEFSIFSENKAENNLSAILEKRVVVVHLEFSLFNCWLLVLQVDASVGTEIGTMTEPDCLGPLDPGTSVNLEGIVWNETDGK